MQNFVRYDSWKILHAHDVEELTLMFYVAAPKSVVSELLRDTSLIDDVTLAVEIDMVCSLDFCSFSCLTLSILIEWH